MQFQSFTYRKNPHNVTEFIDSQYAALLTTWTKDHCESGAFNPLVFDGAYYLHLYTKDAQIDIIRMTQQANLTFLNHYVPFHLIELMRIMVAWRRCIIVLLNIIVMPNCLKNLNK